MLLTAEGLSAYIGHKSYSARDGLNDIICTWRHCMGASLEEKNKSTADAVNSTMLQLATRGLLIKTAQAMLPAASVQKQSEQKDTANLLCRLSSYRLRSWI